MLVMLISFLAGCAMTIPVHIAYRGKIRLIKLDSRSAINNQAFESYVAGFKAGKAYAMGKFYKKARVDADTEVIPIGS